MYTRHTPHTKTKHLICCGKKNCYCVKARLGSQLAFLKLYLITDSLIIWIGFGISGRMHSMELAYRVNRNNTSTFKFDAIAFLLTLTLANYKIHWSQNSILIPPFPSVVSHQINWFWFFVKIFSNSSSLWSHWLVNVQLFSLFLIQNTSFLLTLSNDSHFTEHFIFQIFLFCVVP